MPMANQREGQKYTLNLEEILWNKPVFIKEGKADFLSVYMQFIGVIKREKEARVIYNKEIGQSLNKILELKAYIHRSMENAFLGPNPPSEPNLQQGKYHMQTSTLTFMSLMNILKIYGEVMAKVQDSMAKDIQLVEDTVIAPLEYPLKEDKLISEKLEESIEIIDRYSKDIRKIDQAKRKMFDLHHQYEQSVIRESLLHAITSTYSDDPEKPAEPCHRIKYLKAVDEYRQLVDAFNGSVTGQLEENVINDDHRVETYKEYQNTSASSACA